MRRSLLMIPALFAVGCVPFGNFQLIDSSVLTRAYESRPQPGEAVGVFIGDDVPPEACERVALLRAAATADVVDRLREEAGRVGANAVDLRDFRHRSGDVDREPDDAWNAVALYCPAVTGAGSTTS